MLTAEAKEVAALIKLKDELVSFPVIDLGALSKKNNFPENVRTAVSLYNKAIDRIKFNSSDIAMIELKKAIKIFPEFYDAILLLSLCCYANDEKTRAINLLNTIRDEEERNKCFKYLDSVVNKNVQGAKLTRPLTMSRNEPQMRQGQGQGQRQGQRPERRSQPPQKSYSDYLKIKMKRMLNNPAVFRIGVLLVILLISMGLLYGLYTLYNINKQSSAQSNEFADLQSKYNTALNELDDKTNKINQKKISDKELIINYITPMLIKLDKETEFEFIVKTIYLLDLEVVKDTETYSKLESLNIPCKQKYGNTTFELAKNCIVENKNGEAIAKLTDLIKYYPEYEKSPEVKLRLAEVYIKEEHKEEAIEVLNDIVKSHGQSVQSVDAKRMLDELK